jgi:hypothetical protein
VKSMPTTFFDTVVQPPDVTSVSFGSSFIDCVESINLSSST